jgi:hypothetical protein
LATIKAEEMTNGPSEAVDIKEDLDDMQLSDFVSIKTEQPDELVELFDLGELFSSKFEFF